MAFCWSPKLDVESYRGDVDGLRACAVLLVIAYHAFPQLIPGGFIGVDVFFVISGYLITGIILRALATEKFSFRHFYQRRICRIFPALLVVLAAGLGAGYFLLIPSEYSKLGLHTAAGAGFCLNFFLWRESGYFDIASEFKPLLHLWSLGIEEQFYLVYPLLVWTLQRLKIPISRALFLLALASFSWAVYLTKIDQVAAFFLPHTRLWELLIGGWVWVSGRELDTTWPTSKITAASRVTKEIVAWLGLLSLIAFGIFYEREVPFPGLIALIPIVSSVMILWSGRGSFLNERLLARGLLRHVGLISYSLYLWHWIVLSFARIVHVGELSAQFILCLLFGASVLAWLSFRFVEIPCRSLKGQAALSKTVVTALLVLSMAVVALAGWVVFHNEGYPERMISTVVERAIIERHRLDEAIRREYPLSGCDFELQGVEAGARFCSTTASANNGGRIVIWGDSHAEAWAPAFFEIGRRTGRKVFLFSVRGCPPIVGVRRTDGVSDAKNCESTQTADAILRSIERLSPEHIFLAARWSLYDYGWMQGGILNPASHYLVHGAEQTATRETSRRALQVELPNTIQRLATIAPLTVIGAMPILKYPIDRGIFRAYPEFEPSTIEHRRHEAFTEGLLRQAISEQAKAGKSVNFFDPAQLLCSDDKCRSLRGLTVMYADDNHITSQGALLYINELTRILQ